MRLAQLIVPFWLCSSCTLDYEFGQLGEYFPVLPAAGGEMQIVAFEATVYQTTHLGAGPSGAVDITRDGPWEIDVLAGTSVPNIPPWQLEAGDWQDLELGASFSAPDEPAYLDALYLREGSDPAPVHIEFDESLPLLMIREGQTRLDETLVFTLTERLDPARWFPNINVTNLEAESDGVIYIDSETHVGVYAQVVDALDKSARDWLEP